MFLYHLMDKFARTNYETYEAIRLSTEAALQAMRKLLNIIRRTRLSRKMSYRTWIKENGP